MKELFYFAEALVAAIKAGREEEQNRKAEGM